MPPPATSSPPRYRPALLRELNRRQILAALQAHGPLSRAEISRRTGVSFPTVTRAIASLLAARLIEETNDETTGVGRPGRRVRLARSRVSVIGCAIGVARCELALAGLDGHVDEPLVREFATPPTYNKLLIALAREIAAVQAQSGTTLLSIGASVPGLLNRREGRSLVSPNLHQLDGHCLGADLAARVGVPATLIQESHALCLAEQVFGAAKGIADFAMLDVTGGLGLGVVQRGELLTGHSGLAGELGHLTVELNGRPCGCGNRGCLETVATDAALASAVAERTGSKWTIDRVIAAIRARSLRAEAELARVLDYLAVGAAAVINVFNPQRLFIYGRLFDAGETIFDELLQRVERRALAPNRADCEIVRARGNKRQGAIAAAIQAATAAEA